MKNLIQAKSTFLLVVFCSYTVLSCVQENYGKTQSTKTAVSNIQKRLAKKDYNSEKNVVNPYQDLKKEMKKATKHLVEKLNQKLHPDLRQSNNYSSREGIFRLASIPVIPVNISESLTFGLDNPANVEIAIDEINAYTGGSPSRSEIASIVNTLNNGLLNYPYTNEGANQFLNNYVAAGTLTEAQRQIIQSELYALVNAASSTEIYDIINVVTEEIVSSSMTEEEQYVIHYNNVGIEILIESGAIALLKQNYPFQNAGGFGFAIAFVAGMIVWGVATNYDVDWLQALGGIATFVGLAGIAITTFE